MNAFRMGYSHDADMYFLTRGRGRSKPTKAENVGTDIGGPQ